MAPLLQTDGNCENFTERFRQRRHRFKVVTLSTCGRNKGFAPCRDAHAKYHRSFSRESGVLAAGHSTDGRFPPGAPAFDCLHRLPNPVFLTLTGTECFG
jgi:hypothetical protein